MSLITTALLKKLAWSFGRAFVATFLVGLGGLAAVSSLSAAKAALLALLVAAVTAGIRAVEQVVYPKVTGKTVKNS